MRPFDFHAIGPCSWYHYPLSNEVPVLEVMVLPSKFHPLQIDAGVPALHTDQSCRQCNRQLCVLESA
jgi:hypothetical protein